MCEHMNVMGVRGRKHDVSVFLFVSMSLCAPCDRRMVSLSSAGTLATSQFA